MKTLVRRRYVKPGKAPLHMSAISDQLLEYFGAKVTLVRTNFLNVFRCFSATLIKPNVCKVQSNKSKLFNLGKKIHPLRFPNRPVDHQYRRVDEHDLALPHTR